MHQVLFSIPRPLELNADESKPWVLIGPHGRHPTNDGKRVQVVTPQSVATMVAWFNSVGAKLKRVFGRNSVPAFDGHPDFAPETWPNRRELGSVEALRAGPRGLEAQFALNDAGRAAIKAGRNIYPSSAWDCDPVPHAANEMTPVVLWSVGLCDEPNISSVDPIIAINAAAEQFPEQETETETETASTNIMKKLIGWLIKLALLKQEDENKPEAQEAAVEALITKYEDMQGQLTAANNDKTKAEGDKAAAEAATTAVNATLSTTQAQVGALTTERDGLKTECGRLKGQLTAIAVNALIESGRITKAEEASTITALNAAADFGSAHTALLAKKPAFPTGGPLNLGQARETVANANAARTQVNAWVEQKMGTGVNYDAAFAASKTEPTLKGAWDVLNQKTAA